MRRLIAFLKSKMPGMKKGSDLPSWRNEVREFHRFLFFLADANQRGDQHSLEMGVGVRRSNPDLYVII
jgi:hypothetical protein